MRDKVKISLSIKFGDSTFSVEFLDSLWKSISVFGSGCSFSDGHSSSTVADTRDPNGWRLFPAWSDKQLQIISFLTIIPQKTNNYHIWFINGNNYKTIFSKAVQCHLYLRDGNILGASCLEQSWYPQPCYYYLSIYYKSYSYHEPFICMGFRY